MPVPGRGRVAAELVPPPSKALGVVDREALGVVGWEGGGPTSFKEIL